MAKWSNAAVCKTAIRGFDSHSNLILKKSKNEKLPYFWGSFYFVKNLWITCVENCHPQEISPEKRGLKSN